MSNQVGRLPLDRTATRRRFAALAELQDELANTITHGVGLALSIAGFFFLLALALERGTAWHIAGCTVYGVSLVTLYGVSTWYHGVKDERLKCVLRVVDHACIYLLIAGTYTPFTLTVLRGPWGWTLLTLVWGFAATGIFCKFAYADRIHAASVMPYIVMGWLALIAVRPIVNTLPMNGILWLLAGGLLYTFGVVFFALDERRFFHAVWHLFVLAGSVCHYCAVLFYVIPMSS